MSIWGDWCQSFWVKSIKKIILQTSRIGYYPISMYSIWAKLGLSLGRRGIKIRHNLLSHRNVTKEAVAESVSTIFLSDFFFFFLSCLCLFTWNTFFQKFDLYRLDKGPLQKSAINIKDATYALKTMNCIRRMENRAAEIYRERLINGFLHLYVGQVDEKNLDGAMWTNNCATYHIVNDK